MVYGAYHRAGQLGENGPPRPYIASTSSVVILKGESIISGGTSGRPVGIKTFGIYA
jgi:hypothetical protein